MWQPSSLKPARYQSRTPIAAGLWGRVLSAILNSIIIELMEAEIPAVVIVTWPPKLAVLHAHRFPSGRRVVFRPLLNYLDHKAAATLSEAADNGPSNLRHRVCLAVLRTRLVRLFYNVTASSVLLMAIFFASFDGAINQLSCDVVPASNTVRFLISARSSCLPPRP